VFAAKFWNSNRISPIKLVNKWNGQKALNKLRRRQIAPLLPSNSSSWVCSSKSVVKPEYGRQRQKMKASSAKSFSKKLTCPSSNLLLSFRRQALAPEISFLIRHHLNGCDFCHCEIALLAFHTIPGKGERWTPELPMNLRLLAESILGQDKSEVVIGKRLPECV
jgi:hypothetical protein